MSPWWLPNQREFLDRLLFACAAKTQAGMSMTRTAGCWASGPTFVQAAPTALASASHWSFGGSLSPWKKKVKDKEKLNSPSTAV